jgi:hypothetical protein
MRGFLQGTRHTTLLDRQEPQILAALARLAFVQKVEPLYLNWTGGTQRKLRLSELAPSVLQGTLFLGNGKRQVLILLRRGGELGAAELIAQLVNTLKPFSVDIELQGGKAVANNPIQNTPLPIREISTAEAWAWCLAIYDQVAKVKKLEDEELELEVRLEEVREQKRALQESALNCFASGRKAQ